MSTPTPVPPATAALAPVADLTDLTDLTASAPSKPSETLGPLAEPARRQPAVADGKSSESLKSQNSPVSPGFRFHVRSPANSADYSDYPDIVFAYSLVRLD